MTFTTTFSEWCAGSREARGRVDDPPPNIEGGLLEVHRSLLWCAGDGDLWHPRVDLETSLASHPLIAEFGFHSERFRDQFQSFLRGFLGERWMCPFDDFVLFWFEWVLSDLCFGTLNFICPFGFCLSFGAFLCLFY